MTNTNSTVVEGVKGYESADLDNGVFREKAQDSLAIYKDYVHVIKSEQKYYSYEAIVQIDANGENITDIALAYLIDRAVHPYVGFHVERRRNQAGVLYAKVNSYKE